MVQAIYADYGPCPSLDFGRCFHICAEILRHNPVPPMESQIFWRIRVPVFQIVILEPLCFLVIEWDDIPGLGIFWCVK